MVKVVKIIVKITAVQRYYIMKVMSLSQLKMKTKYKKELDLQRVELKDPS